MQPLQMIFSLTYFETKSARESEALDFKMAREHSHNALSQQRTNPPCSITKSAMIDKLKLSINASLDVTLEIDSVRKVRYGRLTSRSVTLKLLP
jgi:hypothetical protein